MTTVICGYRQCSYNVDGLCGKNFIGIGTKRYGRIINECSGFTTEKVDDVIEEVRVIELKNEEEVDENV